MCILLQVVGLTASLGVGKSGSIHEVGHHSFPPNYSSSFQQSAYDHVMKLLVNMSATSITTVVNNLVELQTHVQLPVDGEKNRERKGK